MFISGQIAWDAHEQIVGPGDFPAQFAQALQNVRAVVEAAGGTVEQVGRLTCYVTDLDAYRSARPQLGPIWRAVFGRHFPAMAVVGVSGLVEPDAMIEIEATAVLSAP